MVPHNSKILLYSKFVDMRKSINGLSILVAENLETQSLIRCTYFTTRGIEG